MCRQQLKTPCLVIDSRLAEEAVLRIIKISLQRNKTTSHMVTVAVFYNLRDQMMISLPIFLPLIIHSRTSHCPLKCIISIT